MAGDLTRRFVTRQLQFAASELERDAERLAVAARIYAEEIVAGRTPRQCAPVAQAAALALIGWRLAGMREIAGPLDADPFTAPPLSEPDQSAIL
ncbi:hypothetical protein [Streptomyces sp. NPDC059631]|uniref:hypothetical protein n=1 Tax=unclassified Streptomyces TaxID=2593676 RepID=UPI0036BC060E